MNYTQIQLRTPDVVSAGAMAARDPVEDPDYLFRDLGGSSGDDDDENLFLARRIREMAALGRPRQQASHPTWLIFAAAAVALTAWILTPPEDPFAAALTS